MDFNVTQNDEFNATVSDSTLQPIFRKLSIVNFLGCSKEKYLPLLKGLLKYSSLLQLQVCMRPDFLHTLQPKEHIATQSMQNKGKSAIFYQTLIRFTKKCKTMPLSVICYYFGNTAILQKKCVIYVCNGV